MNHTTAAPPGARRSYFLLWAILGVIVTMGASQKALANDDVTSSKPMIEISE